MEKRYRDSDIQSISIGLSGEYKINVGQVFRVQLKGQENSGKQEVKVTKIIRDEANFHYFNILSYAVYVSFQDQEHLWQSIEGVPVRVTYNLIYEIHNNSPESVLDGRHGQEEDEEDRGY